jgi:hypothetical protein
MAPRGAPCFSGTSLSPERGTPRVQWVDNTKGPSMHFAIRIALVLLLLPVISCEPAVDTAEDGAQASTDASAPLAEENEQILYTIGFTLAGQLAGFALDEEEFQVVETGLKDGVLGEEAKVDFRVLMPKVQEFQQERLKQVAEIEKAAGQELAARAAA